VICPAYQSTFILDDDTRRAYYSYAWQLDEETRAQYLAQQRTKASDSVTVSPDSLNTVSPPKTDYYAHAGEYMVPWRPTKKSKFGIVKEGFYPVKKYRMRTAPMENVLAPKPAASSFDQNVESLPVDSLNYVAGDSLTTDSLALAQTSPEPLNTEEEASEKVRYRYGYDPADRFNVEQLYYNKYFGDLFIDDRPLPEPQTVASDSLSTSSLDSAAISEKPFLKGLFKKKKKAKTGADTPPVEDSELTGEEAPTEEEPEEQPDNGGGRR